MLILLLVLDAERRERLREACRLSGAEVHGVDPTDASAAVFTVAPDRVDLLVLDPQLLQRQGLAMLANWRRMAPHSRVLLLGEDCNQDLMRLQPVMPTAAAAQAP